MYETTTYNSLKNGDTVRIHGVEWLVSGLSKQGPLVLFTATSTDGARVEAQGGMGDLPVQRRLAT
jgi:hypothetical protein